jgi:hypothetical protein
MKLFTIPMTNAVYFFHLGSPQILPFEKSENSFTDMDIILISLG